MGRPINEGENCYTNTLILINLGRMRPLYWPKRCAHLRKIIGADDAFGFRFYELYYHSGEVNFSCLL